MPTLRMFYWLMKAPARSGAFLFPKTRFVRQKALDSPLTLIICYNYIKGTFDLFMNSYLAPKISSFCAANLANSQLLATIRDSPKGAYCW